MSAPRVQATITVKSEQFQQTVDEPVANESPALYEGLIAANERLKGSLSKILTEYVNKARAEQEANGTPKKRKLERK